MKNKFEIEDNIAIMTVVSKKYGEFKIILDADQVDKVSPYRCGVQAITQGVFGYVDRKRTSLTKFLVPSEFMIHRYNGNNYDYRLSNLRTAKPYEGTEAEILAKTPFAVQHEWAEFPTDFAMGGWAAILSSPQQITDQDREEQLDRMDLIRDCILQAVKQMTPRQQECLSLHFFEGLTQAEVGRRLGIHQTSVFKSIYGSPNYSKAHRGRKSYARNYGGSIKKLKQILLNDPVFLNLMPRFATKPTTICA